LDKICDTGDVVLLGSRKGPESTTKETKVAVMMVKVAGKKTIEVKRWWWAYFLERMLHDPS